MSPLSPRWLVAGFVLWHSSRPCYRTPWFSVTSYHDACYLTNSSVDFVPGNRYLVTLQTCWRFLCASTVRHDTISTNQKSVRLLFWTTQKRAIYTGKFGHAIITLSSTGNGWICSTNTTRTGGCQPPVVSAVLTQINSKNISTHCLPYEKVYASYVMQCRVCYGNTIVQHKQSWLPILLVILLVLLQHQSSLYNHTSYYDEY